MSIDVGAVCVDGAVPSVLVSRADDDADAYSDAAAQSILSLLTRRTHHDLDDLDHLQIMYSSRSRS